MGFELDRLWNRAVYLALARHAAAFGWWVRSDRCYLHLSDRAFLWAFAGLERRKEKGPSCDGPQSGSFSPVVVEGWMTGVVHQVTNVRIFVAIPAQQGLSEPVWAVTDLNFGVGICLSQENTDSSTLGHNVQSPFALTARPVLPGIRRGQRVSQERGQ